MSHEPIEVCVLREVTKRPRGTRSTRASTSVALVAREHIPHALDARQMPLGVATPIDSSSRVGRDNTTRRIYTGVDTRRSSARSSVLSGSTPVRSPVALSRIMTNHTTHQDIMMR